MSTVGPVVFTCPAVPASTGAVNVNDLLKPWPGVGTGSNKRYGLLGDPSNPTVAKSANWMVMDQLENTAQSATFCSNRLQVLISTGEVPKQPDASFLVGVSDPTIATPNPLPAREQDVINFQTRFNAEYCDYQAKYIKAVSYFMTLYTSASTSGNSQGTDLVAARTATLTLNCKVNTLIAWMNYLSKQDKTVLNTLSTQLNTYNTSIQKSQTKLIEQAKALSENTNNSEIFKQMVDYTSEKNRAHQNMLSLYFTLNVVAIAGLFIIARNM